MKSKNQVSDPLILIRQAIAALPPGAERIKLELAVEELQPKLHQKPDKPLFKWIKTLGTMALSLAAIWTLSQGIYEFGRNYKERERAAFLTALANLSDSSSPAKRASALVAIGDYHERHKFIAKNGDVTPFGQQLTVAIGFQILEERSQAFQAILINALYDLADDPIMEALPLRFLVLQNMNLVVDLKNSETNENRFEIKRKLKSSAWAIGHILKDLSAHSGDFHMDPKDALDIEEIGGGKKLTLILEGADLSGLDLGGLDFSGADFSGCIVRSAKFLNATLDSVAIRSLGNAQGADQAILKDEDRRLLNEAGPHVIRR